jgi:S-(hydroxymethyl)glutathione dehydrogenase / alcohol dehydrogenase
MTQAAVLTEVGRPLVVTDVQLAAPGPGEILVDVRASGLCHSDLTFASYNFGHRLPLLLGHEIAGVVTAVGPGVASLGVGEHVVTCLAADCGRCPMCLTGKPWICSNQRSLGRAKELAPRILLDGSPVTQSAHLGGLAEQVLISERAAVAVPKEVPFDRAALLGCSVVTGVGAATNAADIRLGQSVVVIGCGGIGLNVLQGARLVGAGTIIAVDVHESKSYLTTLFGADRFIATTTEDAVTTVRELLPRGADHVFEAVGTASTAAQAVEMTGKAGTTYLVGMTKPTIKFAFDATDLINSGKVIRAVLMGATQFRVDVPRYADLYLAGRLNLDDLVDRTITLSDVNVGFDLMKTGSAARIVVVF